MQGNWHWLPVVLVMAMAVEITRRPLVVSVTPMVPPIVMRVLCARGLTGRGPKARRVRCGARGLQRQRQHADGHAGDAGSRSAFAPLLNAGDREATFATDVGS